MQTYNSFNKMVAGQNTSPLQSYMSEFNGAWRPAKNSEVRVGGTVVDIVENYVLNDGRVLATLYNTRSSCGTKFFHKDEGGVVHFDAEFSRYLGEIPALYEYKKYPAARKKVEQIATKIESTTTPSGTK